MTLAPDRLWQGGRPIARGRAPERSGGGGADCAPASGAGRVTLVGAGPGDPAWLTLGAVAALGAADVVLFDSLVSDEVLAFARSRAKRILVGKRAGRPSCRQQDIQALMIRLARAGHHVVRLKGGDPMIFGRAGEELDELHRERIAVTVVPGISAAQALASALGVSLTRREVARSLRWVTGHAQDGGLPADFDWDAIAEPATTTVIYMGARVAADLVAGLTARGFDPATPVAIGVALGRGGQQAGYVRLADLVACVATIDPVHPILIGIGAVFAEAVRTAEVRLASATTIVSRLPSDTADIAGTPRTASTWGLPAAA